MWSVSQFGSPDVLSHKLPTPERRSDLVILRILASTIHPIRLYGCTTMVCVLLCAPCVENKKTNHILKWSVSLLGSPDVLSHKLPKPERRSDLVILRILASTIHPIRFSSLHA